MYPWSVLTLTKTNFAFEIHETTACILSVTRSVVPRTRSERVVVGFRTTVLSVSTFFVRIDHPVHTADAHTYTFRSEQGPSPGGFLREAGVTRFRTFTRSLKLANRKSQLLIATTRPDPRPPVSPGPTLHGRVPCSGKVTPTLWRARLIPPWTAVAVVSGCGGVGMFVCSVYLIPDGLVVFGPKYRVYGSSSARISIGTDNRRRRRPSPSLPRVWSPVLRNVPSVMVRAGASRETRHFRAGSGPQPTTTADGKSANNDGSRRGQLLRPSRIIISINPRTPGAGDSRALVWRRRWWWRRRRPSDAIKHDDRSSGQRVTQNNLTISTDPCGVRKYFNASTACHASADVITSCDRLTKRKHVIFFYRNPANTCWHAWLYRPSAGGDGPRPWWMFKKKYYFKKLQLFGKSRVTRHVAMEPTVL